MLVREEPDGGVLAITQPEHAALSGRLADAWDDDLPPDLVLATGRHDDVWTELAADEPRLVRAVLDVQVHRIGGCRHALGCEDADGVLERMRERWR